jgi:hypothetical protein
MSIHRRAIKWEHGEIPETLLNLAREHGANATSWNALARAGRAGFKHVGLEIEVVTGGEPPEEIAGAILQMISEHAERTAVEVYRIDAYDESGARLGDVLIRMGDGSADEIENSAAGGGARWALKALQETHDRHMKTLDVIPQLVEMVGQCLEAMGGAVAAAAESKMAYASNEADQQAAEHTHEKQMRMLEVLAAHLSADSKTASDRSPLADLLSTMPDEIREQLRGILGDTFDDMVSAVQTKDRDERRAKVEACLERITDAQKLAMGSQLPEQWRTQLLAAWRAELAG